MKSIVIFGGSGFVGTHICSMLEQLKYYDTIFIADIKKPGWHAPEEITLGPKTVYRSCDVRKPIDSSLFDKNIECIINFAAVHTSPGHPAHEYFEANILGAQNISDFAESMQVKKMIFTSSIAVYGPGEEKKTEAAVPMPNIPYGSSKIVAEYIHRRWFDRAEGRVLLILRPAVIFGKYEGGNFCRIANALEKGIFSYPGRKDTIKSCLYVKDICRMIIEYAQTGSGFSLYNFCYNEEITIETIVKSFKRVLGYKAPEFIIPLWVVNFAVGLLRIFRIPFVVKMGLVPERVVKLVKSTNISSAHLAASGFKQSYTIDAALEDWAKDCNGRHLY